MKGRRTCELCNKEEASLYCPSDSAFLCSNCDATVHEANFLVARHLRYSLCTKCNRFSTRRPTCLSCSPEENKNIPSDSFTSSSSASESSCATSTAKPSENIKLKKKKNTTKKRKRSCSSSVTDDASSPAVERSVFVRWSRELGLGENGDRVASMASHALVFCQGKWRALPFRVAAATSFWLGLIRFCELQNQNLMRLEAISGVPAKLILAAHAKLARVFTHRPEFHNSPQQEEEEGWDES